MKKFLLLALTLLSASLGNAQGWVSSGGELFRDAKNPWFVRNTKQVTYCVQVDETSITASRESILSEVRSAFAYWQNEYSKAAGSGAGHFELGTQVFVEVPCVSSKDLENPDIRFLFGYGSLSEEEIKYLKKPPQFIGVTVRTSYDPKLLRAKGFVYLSSDLGPQSYENKGTLVEKAWSRTMLLKYALLHEVGHIFGVPHLGSGLMSEVFLNQVLNKNTAEFYEKSPVESFLRPNEEIEICHASKAALNWFGADASHQCLFLRMTGFLSNWSLFSKNPNSAEATEIGELRGLQLNLMDQRGRASSVLEITDDQTVFAPKETAFRSFMLGPLMMDMGFAATYFPKSGKRPQPVYVTMTPSSLSIVGQLSPSRLEPVFVFNSPLSILLMKSPSP